MHDSVIRETVQLTGPRGMLPGELAYTDKPTCGSVLLVNPHPYMGGTMDNNVVDALARGLALAGFVTLRFNYHELAGEELTASMLAFWETGHAPQDPCLVSEARAARDWMKRQFDMPYAIVGYSFGGYAAVEILDQEVAAIVLIAPTVQQHDMLTLESSAVRKLVIYSNNDFATTQLATESWYARLAEPKRKAFLVGGDHFFKRQESSLTNLSAEFLHQALSTEAVV